MHSTLYRIAMRLWLLAAAALLCLPPAAAQAGENLERSPFIRQNLDRKNFEPGGQYFLFSSSRGEVDNRQGNITLIPGTDMRIGNLVLEESPFMGDISYITRFSGHGHQEHNPFDEKQSLTKADQQGDISLGFTLYRMAINANKVHPADAYDGPQGGGYPEPTGARDEYSYRITGKAQYFAPMAELPDDRPFLQKARDHFTDSWQGFKRNTENGADDYLNKLKNPRINASGEVLGGVNYLFFGQMGNGVGLLEDASGLSSALQDTGSYGMRAYVGIRGTAQGKMEAVDNIIKSAVFMHHTSQGISILYDQYPNISEATATTFNTLATFTPPGRVFAIVGRGLKNVLKATFNHKSPFKPPKGTGTVASYNTQNTKAVNHSGKAITTHNPAKPKIAKTKTENTGNQNKKLNNPKPATIYGAAGDKVYQTVTPGTGKTAARSIAPGQTPLPAMAAVKPIGGSTAASYNVRAVDHKVSHSSKTIPAHNPSKPKIVNTKSGDTGNWNKKLNNPEPNTIYRIDGDKVYQTDHLVRLSRLDADLSLNKKGRNTYQQCKAGKCGYASDEGGHLISSLLNGPGEKINLVSMDMNLNRGSWKKMENIWTKALKDGKKVKVSIELVYEGNSMRPARFDVEYSINGGKNVIRSFKNAPGGK